MFNRYEKCFGITLYSIGQKRAELWFVLPNYTIKEHTHNQENIELMFLFGKTVFSRSRDGEYAFLTTSWKFFGRCFTVLAGDAHSFTTSSWPLVFINFQTFLGKNKPKSAALDFQPTEE